MDSEAASMTKSSKSSKAGIDYFDTRESLRQMAFEKWPELKGAPKPSGRAFDLLCRGCNDYIFKGKKQRLKDSDLEKWYCSSASCLEHGTTVQSEEGSEPVIIPCNFYSPNGANLSSSSDSAKKRSTIANIASEPIFKAIANHKSGSVELLKTVVPMLGFSGSQNLEHMIKKAKTSNKITANDERDTFAKLEPFLNLLGRQNPGMHCKLVKNDDNKFNKVLVVFPGIEEEFKKCPQIAALDGAHLKDIKGWIKGIGN